MMSITVPEESATEGAGSLFQLRTNTAESDARSFQQRQSDVFSGLANLEAAHKEVTKATKGLRDAVRNAAWRRTTAAPEPLADEKERRDQLNSVSHSHDSSATTNVFRKPSIPQHRRQKRGFHSLRRDPLKWTHYNLADVDEDGSSGSNGDPNFAIASTFIAGLREQRTVAQVEEESTSDTNTKREHRILFRPVRGGKRSRTDEKKPQLSTVHCIASSATQIDEITECSDVSELSTNATDSVTSSVFLQRRRRHHIRHRIGEDAVDPLDEPMGSPEADNEPSPSSDEEDVDQYGVEDPLA